MAIFKPTNLVDLNRVESPLAQLSTALSDFSEEYKKDKEAEQSELLGTALADLALQRTGSTVSPSKTIKGIASNKEAVAKAKKAREESEKKNIEILKEQEKASEDYGKLFDKYSNEWEVKSTVPKGNVYEEIRIPGTTSKVYKTGDGTELPVDPKSWLGKQMYGQKYALKGEEPIMNSVPVKKYSLEKAHSKALEESKIGDVALPGELPSVPDVIGQTADKVIPGVTKEAPLSKKDWTNRTIAALMGDKRFTGTTKAKALEAVPKYADALFGPSATLKTTKYVGSEMDKKKLIEDARKQGYKGESYRGAELYMEDQYSKSKSKKFKSSGLGKALGKVKSAPALLDIIDSLVTTDRDEITEKYLPSWKEDYHDYQIAEAVIAAIDEEGYVDHEDVTAFLASSKKKAK